MQILCITPLSWQLWSISFEGDNSVRGQPLRLKNTNRNLILTLTKQVVEVAILLLLYVATLACQKTQLTQLNKHNEGDNPKQPMDCSAHQAVRTVQHFRSILLRATVQYSPRQQTTRGRER